MLEGFRHNLSEYVELLYNSVFNITHIFLAINFAIEVKQKMLSLTT